MRILAANRRALLLERLERDGRVVAKDIAAELSLSEDSIRRDLRELAAEGLLTRVYGGAVPASPALANYAARTEIATASKRRVAAAAVGMITPGSTVILDGGTTTLSMVQLLPRALHATIITHSATIAAALLHHEADVLLLGGRLFKHSAVTVGAAAVEAAARVSADLFFLGVTGIHPSEALTTGDSDEAAMKRALASRSAETFALGSTEKIGTVSRHQVLPLDGVTGLILDTSHSDPTVADLRAAGGRVLTTR